MKEEIKTAVKNFVENNPGISKQEIYKKFYRELTLEELDEVLNS